MGRASEKRMARVSSLIQRTLSELISDELSDPRIGIFSITGVQMSPDLSYADISVAAVGGSESSAGCADVLNSASPLLRNRLRDATDLRIVPRLRFVADRGLDYSDEINKLLADLPEPGDDAGEEGPDD
ncbi:MAG TPA: 30S ribosome-binding factor RbfA [Firmicutes bacterium]|nr:30S ribosome-binding factor RbfA [Bacillota bacterium]